MLKASLGEQELEMLRFISERGPITTGAVVDAYGVEHGLARTTIHTMLERLRKKGYLTREKVGGVYSYASSLPKSELLAGLVGNFLQRTLHGSLTPLVAYLADTPDLNDEEIGELRALVEALEARKQENKRHDA